MQLSPHFKKSGKIFSGSGNRFYLTYLAPEHIPIPALCAAYDVDGVITYHAPLMRIFNADGSEASMCGNGLRCLIAFLWEEGDRRPRYTIKTKAGWHEGYYRSHDEVTVCFPLPSSMQVACISGWEFFVINTGVPHAVREAPLDWLLEVGSELVQHPVWGPEGSNITSYWFSEQTGWHTATFERGLHKISGACGTGCMAVSHVRYATEEHATPPFRWIVPSGEEVLVTIHPPTLTGFVHKKDFSPIMTPS